MRAAVLIALASAFLSGCAGEPKADATDGPPVADWLQGYLRVDTTNPPGGEAEAAEYLQSILRRAGIPSRLVVTPEGRTNLYSRLRARPGVDGPALVLLHHMDVVAPGEGWTVDPFGGEISDGRLWGRGALDAKSLGIVELAAFVAAARRDELARDLVFLAVADEEAGGVRGTGWLLEEHPELFAGVEAIVNEGGSNRQVNERLLWWGIEVAQKRPLWLEVTARGRSGHAAGYNPGSAVHTLVDALARLVDRPDPWRVTPAARVYLEALAPLHNERWQRVFTSLDRVIAPDGPTEALMPGLATLFVDTIQVTVLRGSPQINVVPSEASARVDGRLLPDTDADALLKEIRGILGDDVELDVLLTAPPTRPSPAEGTVWTIFEEVFGVEAPVVPFFSPGFTDSRFFRALGIPAYGVSPFTLEPQELRGIHGPDEAIPLDELWAGSRRLRSVVTAWVEGS